MRMRKIAEWCAAVTAALWMLAGCSLNAGSSEGTVTSGASSDTSAGAASGASAGGDSSGTGGSADAEMFSNRDLRDSYEADSPLLTFLESGVSGSADGVTVSGTTVTITAAGTYRLTGSCEDGQVVVETGKEDKVQLVLEGLQLRSATSAALYVKCADKVFVTLAEGSDNTLENGGSYVAVGDNNIDSVIFSKEDLTLNGKGALTVTAAAGHGIVSKDDLVIAGGTYTVEAASHGLCGKDSIRIADGTLTVTAGKDGLHAENKDDSTLGFLYISGGTFTVTAAGDGLSAAAYARIEGGSFALTCGGGAAAAAGHNEGFDRFPFGYDTTESDGTVSSKGIKAVEELTVTGGTFAVDSADDALHSNGTVQIEDGQFTLSTGDDGIHADDTLTVQDGLIRITKSYEGLEAQTLTIAGGEIEVTASDDGLNAAGGADQSGFGGMGGRPQDTFASGSAAQLTITGGTIRINASGDGIDSNGNLTIAGGEVYVSGSTDNGNGALDYDGTATITGGIVVAAGSTGMAQNFGSNSTQGSMLVNCSGSAGSEIVLQDADGKVLVRYTSEKAYACAVISCPELTVGSTYTVTVGGSSVSVTLSSLIYGGSGMGGPGGDMGGNPGGGPGGMGGGPGRRP